jgi:GNAT superfamily N-acetyltransferase
MPWDEIMKIERESWPQEMRATREQLQSRLEVFPEGFFLAYRDGELVGFATCQIVAYNDKLLGQSWARWTDNGEIRKSHDPDGNALFGISMCTRPRFRGRGVSSELMEKFKGLAKKRGLECVFFGSRLSSLDTFLRHGLEVVRTVPNYDDDSESNNWAVLVRWPNPKAT